MNYKLVFDSRKLRKTNEINKILTKSYNFLFSRFLLILQWLRKYLRDPVIKDIETKTVRARKKVSLQKLLEKTYGLMMPSYLTQLQKFIFKKRREIKLHNLTSDL